MNTNPITTGVLIYDGECKLCQKTRDWFGKRDLNSRIKFVTAQEKDLLARFPELEEIDLLSEITWIDNARNVRRGADAIAAALKVLPKYCWLGCLLTLPGTTLLRQNTYRFVAHNRYAWFGRSCEGNSCQLNRSPRKSKLSPWLVPTTFSCLVLWLVVSPITENFQTTKNAQDSFPLSYYPMFSSRRSNNYEQAYIVAVKADGTFVPVHYKMLGSGGLNQKRRQLGKLMKKSRRAELQRLLIEVAQKVDVSGKQKYSNCTSVAAVKGTYDLQAYFTRRNQQPSKVKTVMECPLPAISTVATR